MCQDGTWTRKRDDGLFFDEDARSPLGGLGANTTLQTVFQYSVNKSLVVDITMTV